MRKKPLYALMAVAAIGLGVLAWATSKRAPVDPIYQGRTLSSWLEAYPTSWNEVGKKGKSPEDQQRADEAIRAIGTNSFPLLLDWISAKDGRLKSTIISFANNHPKIPIRLRSAEQKRLLAVRGFNTLGESARLAQDRLLEVFKTGNPDTKRAAMLSLQGVIARDSGRLHTDPLK